MTETPRVAKSYFFNQKWDELKDKLIKELWHQKDTANEGGLIIALNIMVDMENELVVRDDDDGE